MDEKTAPLKATTDAVDADKPKSGFKYYLVGIHFLPDALELTRPRKYSSMQICKRGSCMPSPSLAPLSQGLPCP